MPCHRLKVTLICLVGDVTRTEQFAVVPEKVRVVLTRFARGSMAAFALMDRIITHNKICRQF